jgi:hypothetical protein
MKIKHTAKFDFETQLPGHGVQGVFISEHDDGYFYGSVLYLKRREYVNVFGASENTKGTCEPKLKTFIDMSSDSVKKQILNWASEVGAPENELIERN